MKHYTWEEKIDSLVKLAKATGKYTNIITEVGTDGYKEARQQLFDAYEEFCNWRHEEPYVVDEIKALVAQKDAAYWERNQLVAALSKLYPAWLEYHKEEEEGWRWIVFIEIPTKELENKYVQGGYEVKHKRQVSWHIHNSEITNFGHLPTKRGNAWDGHTSEEKYMRLTHIIGRKDRNWLVRLFLGNK